MIRIRFHLFSSKTNNNNNSFIHIIEWWKICSNVINLYAFHRIALHSTILEWNDVTPLLYQRYRQRMATLGQIRQPTSPRHDNRQVQLDRTVKKNIPIDVRDRMNEGRQKLTLHKIVRSFWLSRCISTRNAPFGPRTRTVSWPAPAPRVSQMNLDWNVANTPCSMPGP